jgi:hypothetical protein
VCASGIYREKETIVSIWRTIRIAFCYLSRLISVLICSGCHAGLLLKKGGLSTRHIESLRYGACGTLVCLLTP